MANTHLQPDSYYELQAVFGDLGPAVIVSHSGLTVPASSLTLPAVAANGYVLATGPPARLVYVSQPAVSVTLSVTNGNWWLALHADLSTPVAGWTRRSGSHFLVQQAATQPANPAGGLVFAQVTVAGLVITAVSPLLPVTSAPMSRQNSHAVAITGGNATLDNVTVNNIGQFNNQVGIGMAPSVGRHLTADNTYLNTLTVAGTVSFTTYVGMNGASPAANIALNIGQNKAGGQRGITVRSTNGDTTQNAMDYINASGGIVGSISYTATATAFNTSSDVRLKEKIALLVGALDVIRALRPVSFHWQADGSKGNGFLAHELMTAIPEAVSGLPDEVNSDGSIKPQQVDHSKLVVWLVGACQELAARVEALEARLPA